MLFCVVLKKTVQSYTLFLKGGKGIKGNKRIKRNKGIKVVKGNKGEGSQQKTNKKQPAWPLGGMQVALCRSK